MTRSDPLVAVFFDVGNTLLFPYPSVSHVVEEVLRDAGHGRDLAAIEELMPLIDAYYENRFEDDETFWTSEKAASGVWVDMYSLLARRLGVEDEATHIARAVYDEFGKPERWRVYDDVIPEMQRLRAQGTRLGAISNWDGRLEGLMDGLGLTRLLDTVVCSAAVGFHKPDPRIFELACERVGAEPAACAHVGDQVYSDILGARGAGMTAVLIDRAGKWSPTAVPIIRTLDELEGALR
ncbi:MAG TPA: HAD-IA family hydrolase [Coriobacteriia bacterium]